MAKNQVTAAAASQTVLFAEPMKEFIILVPDTEAANVLITPIGLDLAETGQNVCIPNFAVVFEHDYFVGFKYQRETVDAKVNYYCTKYAPKSTVKAL